jgi:methyltransferase (TIGR00027 family)
LSEFDDDGWGKVLKPCYEPPTDDVDPHNSPAAQHGLGADGAVRRQDRGHFETKRQFDSLPDLEVRRRSSPSRSVAYAAWPIGRDTHYPLERIIRMSSTPELSAVHTTAFAAAIMRARHLIVDGHPKILEDPFALLLIGLDADQLASSTNQYGVDPRASSSTWILRSRFAEDRLAAARTRNVHQYVILGAGLDSYAVRNAESLGELIVYEVDDPPLQHWKRQRLQELHIATPANLRFIACDFEAISLPEALRASTFDSGAPAEVSWLGVTQYLTRAAVVETLRWVASLATGSEIVLTYIVPGEAAEAAKQRWAARGTRFETFFTPDEMMAVLEEAGLVDIEHLTPEEGQKAYFEGRTDDLAAPTLERLVVGKAP